MPHKQLPHWSQLEHRGSDDATRPPMVHPEPLRPIEPGESQNTSRSFPRGPSGDNMQIPHRQQLPGVHELLSPAVRTGARSPVSETWAPTKNPSVWRDRLQPAAGGLAHTSPHAAPTAFQPVQPVQPPHYHYQAETPISEKYSQAGTRLPVGTVLQRPPSMPMLTLRQPELSSPTARARQDFSLRGGEYYSSPAYQSMGSIGSIGSMGSMGSIGSMV